jgi:hypothetical protein
MLLIVQLSDFKHRVKDNYTKVNEHQNYEALPMPQFMKLFVKLLFPAYLNAMIYMNFIHKEILPD